MDIKALLENLNKLRIPHYYCQDSWYSCPLAEDGCSDDQWDKDKCNCGADKHNALIDQMVAELTTT